MLEKVTEMVATKIKAPFGSICEKYVYTSFIDEDIIVIFQAFWLDFG